MKKDFKAAVEEVKMHSDVVDIIGSYLPLKRAGHTFKACCPFHKEKTPSFNVNPERQIYHCFGCGAGGDVIHFVQEYEKVDFMTALRLLAEKSGITLDFDREAQGDGPSKNRLYEIHEFATNFYHRQLLDSPAGQAGRDYLAGRELSPEIVKEFLIGYIPEGWNALLDHLKQKGFTQAELDASGLVVESQKKPGNFYDRFRDRLMFPIADQMGRIIGFSGRTIVKDFDGGKYVNSPETPLFHKSRVLFALDKARKAIADSHTALVVEGQIDAIRCHEAGITNTVASQGTALTIDHARVIRRYADEVVLILDADSAGENAALKSIEAFLSVELNVRVCSLPKGEDPDSLIKKYGVEPFNELVANAPDAIDFQIAVLSGREDISNNAGLMRVVKAVQQTLSQIRSSVLREKMTEHAADSLNISADALRQDVRAEVLSRPEQKKVEPPTAPPRKRVQLPTAETELCKLLASYHEDLLHIVADYITPEHFTSKDCRKIYTILLKHDVSELMNELHSVSDECLRLAAEIQSTPEKNISEIFGKEEEVHGFMLKLICDRAELERDHLKQKRQQGQADEQTHRRIVEITQLLSAAKRGWESASRYLEPLH
jgi:DNA primase